MKNILLICIILISPFSYSQTQDPILGSCTLDELRLADWFTPNFDAYQPDQNEIAQLHRSALKKQQIKIFFGSWCGDSKREVPRMVKVLEQVGYRLENIELIGVASEDSVYKQSPEGQTKDAFVFRVPTMILYKDQVEVNRIIEEPMLSLESDLNQMLSGQPYQTTYPSYVHLQQLLQNGVLSREEIHLKGLAHSFEGICSSSSFLNTAGYVLIAQDKLDEAIRVFEINYLLFPKEPNVYLSLAEALEKAQQYERAKQFLQHAFYLEDIGRYTKYALAQYESVVLKMNESK